MKANHNPGPWQWDDDPVGEIDYDERAPWLIDSFGNPVISGEISVRTSANARLIAAAPDLLQALQLLLIVVDAPDDDPDIVRAKNAVAKATGEPQ